MFDQLSLRLRVFLFFALIAAGGSVVAAGALWLGYRRLDDASGAGAFLLSWIVTSFGLLGLCAWIWLLFDENVAKPVLALATDLRARTLSDVSHDIDCLPARYLGDLAPAAQAAAMSLNDVKSQLDEEVERKTERLRADKARLEGLVRDLPGAVVLCNREHRIVLYNREAASLLKQVGEVGLDRNVLGMLSAAELKHAHDHLVDVPDDRSVTLHCATCDGQHRLRVQMRLVENGGANDGGIGYLLTLTSETPEAEYAAEATVGETTEFYDFRLFSGDARGIDDKRPLDALTFVVFDTETTGLLPDQGDEIVQIAAVRIVRGRMLKRETLDLLVNPERSIPESSTKIHGITEAMVADAPTIDIVGRQFHRYCENAVLVAHNAPFDMAFLKRHEPDIGATFDQPILDTILLSAILFGTTAQHSLDALAERLGIEIAEEDRHTARGDAIATAQALIRMIPMLQEAGFTTLGETVQEFRKHKRLIELPLRS